MDIEIERAKNKDEARYNEATAKFNEQYAIWEKITKLAQGILIGDIESYKSLIKEWKIWLDIKEIGDLEDIDIHDKDKVNITFKDDPNCVPQHKKRVLKKGDISVKMLSNSSYYEIYQSYICSSAIRVIREIFAVLPVNTVQVNIATNFESGIQDISKFV